MTEYLGKLVKAAIVDCLKEGGFADSLGGSNALLGKVILLQRLNKFGSGRKLFQMVENK